MPKFKPNADELAQLVQDLTAEVHSARRPIIHQVSAKSNIAQMSRELDLQMTSFYRRANGLPPLKYQPSQDLLQRNAEDEEAKNRHLEAIERELHELKHDRLIPTNPKSRTLQTWIFGRKWAQIKAKPPNTAPVLESPAPSQIPDDFGLPDKEEYTGAEIWEAAKRYRFSSRSTAYRRMRKAAETWGEPLLFAHETALSMLTDWKNKASQ